jgi:restriction system protein
MVINFYGTGEGLLRCPSCRKSNQVPPMRLTRQINAAAREANRAQKAYERSLQLGEKEKQRLYVESRIAETNFQTEQLQDLIAQLESVLSQTLAVDDYVPFEALKEQVDIESFDPHGLDVPEVPPAPLQIPQEPKRLASRIPGAKERHARAVADATARFEQASAGWTERERHRENALAAARREYEQAAAKRKAEAEPRNAQVDAKRADFEAGKPDTIVWYFSEVLQTRAYPSGFPHQFRMAFVPESKQLVVEVELPGYDIVPETASYKYVKARDAIDPTKRPATQRKALYASLISQITLRTLHELFEADRTSKLETIVFNGYVATTDRATGHAVKPHLVTVRTNRDAFTAIDLSNVEPAACLRGLNASVSRSPAELAPVRPILELNMVDPRFIQETDVLSTLDERPNLMDLTPGEFENLITNLFENMGLETRLTQASRDGGVDCVAYDPRPIFGGKVVIQAKRYKNTVGVSAVRDLFGTMQNEGASKGILVTTSGYGKAAFEFADGKPMELLSGSNLLYLLEEHAGIQAKIEVPDDWVDPVPDS